jgi:4-carboxymuconolactone decarboxylase
MPRLPQITSREEIAEDKRDIYDAIMGTRKRVAGPFSMLLYSPELAGRTAHLGTYLRWESVFTQAERETAILVAARESDCGYEFYSHSILAREAGVREEAIQAIANRLPIDRFTPEEATIVAYGRELLQTHRVSSETFEAAKAKYGAQGMVDLTATLGYYTMMACTINAFEVEPPAGQGLPK